MPASPRRVFISYAWESEEYRSWVQRLAARLRADGVEARLDVWHLGENDNIPEFMNREIRQADRVLLLCSPGYRRKVHAQEDGRHPTGVGWEARLINAQLFVLAENKLLAALAAGAWANAAPDFLLGQRYDDLSDLRTFEAHYRSLLQRITGTLEKAPPLGELPSDLAQVPVEPLRGMGAVEAQAPAPSPPESRLEFTLRTSAPGEPAPWTVELRMDGGPPLAAPFRLDLAASDSQTARDLEAIRENRCTIDDIQNLGSELWTHLLGGPIEEEFERARRRCRGHEDGILQIRLTLPPELEDLPWEALWDFDELSLATSPRVAVVRSPSAETLEEAHRPPPGAVVRMLVVMPEGSGLNTSSEWERIRQSVLAADGRVQLEVLDGRVTPNRFAEALRQDWDVVHFIGHGRLDSQARVELRLNREASGAAPEEDEEWLSARLFAQQFRRHPAQLVTVNACHGGSLDPQALSSLSAYLARARVAATLVLRYAIQDSAAAEFAAAFYRELFTGERPGRIDLAVQEGRATLERTFRDGDRVRSAITPVLYLASGCEQMFDLSLPAPPRAEEIETRDQPQVLERLRLDERLDRKLVHAIATRCCVPILGPGILAAGAERQQRVPPGPGSLAQRLAALSAFPGFERITPLTDSAADWLTPVLFERICQHFESVADGERRELNEAIQEVYRPFAPPPALGQIAAWTVPGLVYTYIDGLLEQSLQHLRGRNLRVVLAEDLQEGSSPGSGEVVLVNLRGSHAAPTMVLTEEDEDRLLDRMPVIAAFVADLMNRVGGCNLLFLGVSARDPLVRALARRLLRDDVARNRGTAFFVSDQTAAADQAWWYQFKKLEWLEIDVDTVIAGLTVAARVAEERG